MVACILDAMMKAREASLQWMIFIAPLAMDGLRQCIFMARLFSKIPLPEYIVTPAAALLASVAMTTFLPQGILLFLAFFHYYWEGAMWKNGSPHRKNIYV